MVQVLSLKHIQHVVVDRGESEEVEITSTVPQGSVVDPIFLLIYINNMAKYTKHSSIRLFANDTIIYLILTAENNCVKCQ